MRAGRVAPRGGQVGLFALIAVSLVLLVLALLAARQQGVQAAADEQERTARVLSERTAQLRTVVEGVVAESLSQAVNEVAETGGFTAEAVPPPSHMGLPVLVDRGNLVNFPSERTLERMLREELRRRLESNLFDAARMERYGVARVQVAGAVSVQEDDLRLGDNYVSYTLHVPVSAEVGGQRAVLREPVTVELQLRLLRLVRLARAFAELYTKSADKLGLEENPWERELERLLSYLMANDLALPEASAEPHVPVQPFLLEPNLGREEAERTRGFCTLCRDVTYPFTELKREVGRDVLVASTMFSTKAGSDEFQRALLRSSGMARGGDEEVRSISRGLEWEFVPLIGDADEGFPALDLTVNGAANDLVVSGKPPEEASCPDPRCSCCKWFAARYLVLFPLEVRLTDLLPSGAVKGSSTAVRPLQLRFVLRAQLERTSPLGTGLEPAVVLEPREYDLACTGHCSLRVRPEGVDEATVALAPCLQELSFPFDSSRMAHVDTGLGVPCGVHELVVTPNDTERFGVARVTVQIPSADVVRVEVPRFRALQGRVLANTTVLCSDRRGALACLDRSSGAIAHDGACTPSDKAVMEPLGYIPGSPPSYVVLTLVPLDPGLGRLEATTTEDGRYAFSRVLPGRYLFVASPSVDAAGNVGHKVRTWAELVRVTEDSDEDIVMQPVFSANVTGSFVPVLQERGCAK